MAEQGLHKIGLLQRRYISYQLIADALFAAALAILSGCLLYIFFSLPAGWSVLFFVAIFGGIAGLKRWWQTDIFVITTFLNLKYPDLEESSELTLKDPGELNLLEKLQLAKVEMALEAVPSVQKQFTQRLRLSILAFLAVAAFGLTTVKLHGYLHQNTNNLPGRANTASKNNPPEKILPQVESVNMIIAPPAYTHKAHREQDKFALEVEEGSMITWKLKLNVNARRVSLLFNSREKIALESKGDDLYSGSQTIDKPGFYQVDIDGKLSDLYAVQVIKDDPPVIHIKTPQQYTSIDPGEAPKVNITARIDDDYGITNAFIYATIAKGSGEAVKFKEQKIDFTSSFGGHDPHYDLQKLISLPSLDIAPGDELYFYIQAQDTRNQQSRTDVYIVTVQDTAQLLSMDNLLSGLNVKPEYFRSQRQIILDSQKLLQQKDSIGREAFNNRSNDLATDQKLLRLRYGKFLGEEAESAIDPSQEKDNPVGDIKNFGNAAVVLDAYTDKHDNAEDAQFFDPVVKAQLKATLNEMWKAELQLRLYKPQAALPFEYKALRLLKDLQQKSRVYVAKTAYNPAPIKMEKRLTGDLSKIIQPVNQQDTKAGGDEFASLRNVTGILEQLKAGTRLSGADRHSLQLANQQLSEKAAVQPGIYLTAVSAMHRILSMERAKSDDIGVIEEAIQWLLPPGKQLPADRPGAADMGLSGAYYKNLNRK